MQRLIRMLLPVAILLVGWLGYSLLSVEKEEEKRPEPKERVLKTTVHELRREDYQATVRAHGIAAPHSEASLTAQVSGKIRRIAPDLEDGAFFEQNEILLELDAEDFEAAVIAAEAQLARAAAVLSQEEVRSKQARLNWEDLGYDEEPNDLVLRLPQLREAKANVKAATASLERAKRDLKRTQIRAPFDGRVQKRHVAIGQTISPGTALATIYHTEFLEVRLAIPIKDLGFLNLPEGPDAPPLEVTFFDDIDRATPSPWIGSIVGTEGTLDRDSRELFVIARVYDPFNLRKTSGPNHPPLRVGQPVRAAIKGRVLRDAIVVPRSAIHNVDTIFLVDRDKLELERRTIEWVHEDKDNLIIQDPTIPDRSLVATSRLVYAPNASKVEIIQSLDTETDAPITSQDGEGDKKDKT